MPRSPDPVLILGLAREGVSLARYFHERGERVIVTDPWSESRLSGFAGMLDSGIELYLGADHPHLVEKAARFFVSPGVPEDNPVYREARRAGLVVESMTTLFFELCPAPIIGITGSSGKTTTTALIGHILRVTARDVVVGGNIGEPMLDLLPLIRPETNVVLELSSFQLSILCRSPHIAVVTNISANHLDRHGTMEAYIAAKRRIVSYQSPGDHAVLNAEDSIVRSFTSDTSAAVTWFGGELGKREGATVCGGFLGLCDGASFRPVASLASLPLLGRHNVENVLAAIAVAALLRVPALEMAEAIATCRPPAHRLQLVRERDGVRFIDDSIATSPARVVVALRSLDAPVVLIAGGRDKKLPWEEFAEVIPRKARALLLIGEAAPLIEQQVRAHLDGKDALLNASAIRQCATLELAVTEASRIAQPGDTVLLSPGCTSYDMFRDYEERAHAFVRAVEGLDAA